MSIEKLPSVSSLSTADLAPIGSKALGDDAKVTLSTLIAFIVANFPSLAPIQYEELSDGDTVDLTTYNAPLAGALSALSSAIVVKQDELVSGNNIKTINGASILGSGDLTVAGGGGGAVSSVAGKTGAVLLDKNDVSLGNVDNTADSTKNGAVATLTNKTMNGANNTFSNLPASGINGVIPIANLASGTPNGAKFIRDDGTLATPAGSGTVTNTGGALTANSPVLGAGTTDAKVVAGITSDGVSKLVLGVAGTSVGALDFKNATSGTVNLKPVTGALGTSNLLLPAASDTLVGKATTDQLTNKDLNGATISGVTNVTGAFVAAGTAKTTDISFLIPQGDYTLTANLTIATVTGSPATGQSTLLKFIGDTVDRTVTLPAGTWRSQTKQATITSFVMPASQIIYVLVIKTAAGYDISGEPQPLSLRSWSRTQTTGANETKTLTAYAAQAGTISAIYGKTSSGTISVKVQINGVDVTGATCTAATTRATGAASAANVFAIGDVITIVYSANSSAANTDVTVTWTPTLL